jgi:putative flippase GtrA
MGEFARFGAAGAVGTALHYVVLVALVTAWNVGPVVASTAGSVAGALVNFALSHRVVFRSTKPVASTIWKFFVVAGLGLVLNTLLMYATVDVLGLHYLVGQVVSTGLVLVSNYVCNSLWTFGRRAR